MKWMIIETNLNENKRDLNMLLGGDLTILERWRLGPTCSSVGIIDLAVGCEWLLSNNL